MKNATVTMPYDDFQTIKNKADQYENEKQKHEDHDEETLNFIEILCGCIEKGAACKEPQGKQYFLFKGLSAICAQYEMDMQEEYGEIDPGTEPVD